ncbi:MAG: hypothetical protein JWM44_3525 [Bacilli bacterium]|nr:hypothetical protein [Bacilli bacterium]
MSKPIQRFMTVVAMSSLLLTAASPAWADGADPVNSATPATNTVTIPVDNRSPGERLFTSLQSNIEYVFNEQTSDGTTRTIALVKLKNVSGKAVAIPNYEIRMETVRGTEYTMQAGSGNVKTIQPYSEAEFSYISLSEVDSQITPAKINWVDVNLEVYPKTETVILSLPVPKGTWQNDSSDINDQTAIKKWGEKFTISSTNSPLTYTPVSIKQDKILANQTEKNVTVVTFLVENPSAKKETVPDLVVNGKTDSEVLYSSRVEQGPIVLERKEQKYVVYEFLTQDNVKLTSLNIQTPESYSQLDAKGQLAMNSYSIGRLKIQLPQDNVDLQANVIDYVADSALKLDSISTAIPSALQISIAGESLLANEDVGFKTMLVKFKLNNMGNETIALPDIPLELLSPDGYHYAGTRESTSIQQLIPNTSYIVSYTFLLPSSESGQQLTLQVFDNQIRAPFKTILAAYRLTLPTESTDDLAFALYPYKLIISSEEAPSTTVGIDPLTGSATTGLVWKTSINLIRAQNVLVSTTSSKLQFELLDGNSKLLGTSILGFSGTQKLIDGEQYIRFNSLDINSNTRFTPLTINIYETYDTPLGLVKRYLGKYVKS